ncbi:hypothetical protein BFP72_12655 [Reichenbachiella sp. 5M10]|uniref:tellurite resistance TerB family protein n=1 Tax=Reichenbachiella sp. 5M10 TaxID=1889772 RepID=UPI000C152F49|nr:TerB family tellurite resistance protein [Reichenbachiella sp. 5M10]PIB36185.1 hypothetical protein BFP72_12655 [Reichenbachiella sp. 5M10]
MNKPSEITLDVFGKILYALAMADGKVQDAEIKVLQQIVREDEWADRIKLSFDTAMDLEMDPKMVFYKNIRILKTLRSVEYMPYFIHLMNRVAQAHGGVVPAEKEMILDLAEQFKGEEILA